MKEANLVELFVEVLMSGNCGEKCGTTEDSPDAHDLEIHNAQQEWILTQRRCSAFRLPFTILASFKHLSQSYRIPH